jgi:nitrous oxide reductase accessory protein NosL
MLFSALLLSAASLLPVESKPLVAPKGTAPEGRCAVCGMYVTNYPDWAASITFKDGTLAWFDGPKDLFTFMLDPTRYAARRKASDLVDICVKDYYGLKATDGRKAFYVLGSDVMGPMGRDLVPFASETGARDFLKDHRGHRLLTFQEVTPELLKQME